ncbi:MAG: single-stranded-DNA-specific exonuclease RecJ, partial [Desulfobacterales bacterium]|nr:single-stranded-DNA-specific exonuclease RecJ [Desulfobacterales bacterium]
MKKQWNLLEPDPAVVANLSRKLNCHPITATVMVNRNIITASDAHDFLTISLGKMRSPFSLKDMEAAVDRIYAAITGNERILIFGDYDVDGITATAI